MPLQHELARFVNQRCEEIGLTRHRLSELSVVDVDIVRQLLDATSDDLSLSRAECIANAVGLTLGILEHRRWRQGAQSAISVASRSASTSFRDLMPPDALADSLTTGLAATEYGPHIRALLEDVPMGQPAAFADAMQERRGTPAAQTWQKMWQLASSLACLRPFGSEFCTCGTCASPQSTLRTSSLLPSKLAERSGQLVRRYELGERKERKRPPLWGGRCVPLRTQHRS